MDQEQRDGESIANPSGGWKSYESVFTNAKAGMDFVDKEKVKKIVYEMSKDSPCFKNEQRKQAQVDEKISRLKAQQKKLSPAELDVFTRKLDGRVAALEAGRDFTRTWLHVDMDAFYASVEELDDPTLKDKPMAVGGKSMISTANYLARRYGVRSAMPGFIAVKLCPHLVFVKPDFSKYRRASEATRAVFRSYDPDFDPGSLDEAYLDCTEYCQRNSMTGAEVAAELRMRILKETQLTCSVGVAANRMLAKVSSDINKPNGQHAVKSDRSSVMEFMKTLPVRKIPGIGKVTGQMLSAFDINVCGDLIEKRGLISALFSPSANAFLLEVSLGLGRTTHWEQPGEGEVGRKGISCERTFQPISSRPDLEQKAEELAQHLSEDMAKEKLKGQTVTLKLKLSSFEIRTRAITLPHYVCSAQEILKPVLKLLAAELPIKIRLMGVRVSNFWEDRRDPGQPTLAKFFKRNDQDAGHRDDAGTSAQPSTPDCIDLEAMEATPAHGDEPQNNEGGCPFGDQDQLPQSCNENCLPNQADPPEEEQKHDIIMSDDEIIEVITPIRGSSVWKCDRCGEVMEYPQRQEHQDFHVALDMKKEEDRINKIMQVGLEKKKSVAKGSTKQRRGSKRRDSNIGSLDMFLVKKPKS
ncbi:hypothetical protein BSKO_03099 [Bryopsis sp. KO-2023]|nr:hypothetical protein BSKO_03099 [Bryopsis sp. KO-2023]